MASESQKKEKQTVMASESQKKEKQTVMASESQVEEMEKEICSTEEGVILGVDGGTTSTTCVCVSLLPFDRRQLPDPIPVLGRADARSSNSNSIGDEAARETLEKVIKEALSNAGKNTSAVLSICLGVSGVNQPSDQERLLNWVRNIFPDNVKIYAQNDAVPALASGTMGELHGCVLIVGTGCIAYGVTEDGREASAAGAGPLLGDWGSGHGIASRALTAVVKAHDGRGPPTMLTDRILQSLGLSSPNEIIRWTYADHAWDRIAALVPHVISCADDGDQVADEILNNTVQELVVCVNAVVQRLQLAGEDGNDSFPFVMVGGVLAANRRRDIGREVRDSVLRIYPRALPIRPTVEPAVGAALFAWNTMMKEARGNDQR